MPAIVTPSASQYRRHVDHSASESGTLTNDGHLVEGLDEAAADRLDAAFPRTLADSSRTLDSGGVVDISR